MFFFLSLFLSRWACSQAKNNMVANSLKFHVILLSKNCNLTDRIPMKIKQNLIESETQVDLLGLKIDNSTAVSVLSAKKLQNS